MGTNLAILTQWKNLTNNSVFPWEMFQDFMVYHKIVACFENMSKHRLPALSCL